MFNILALISWVLLSNESMDRAHKIIVAALAANLVTSILMLALVVGSPNEPAIFTAHSLCLFVIVILSVAQVRTFVIIQSQLSVFFLVAFFGGYATRIFMVMTLSLPPVHGKLLAQSAETAGIFNKMMLIWAFPMIWKGRGADIQIDSLEELNSTFNSTVLFQLFKVAWKHPKNLMHGKPSLEKALLHSFLPYLLSPVLPGLVRALAQGLQPLLVLASLKFIQSYSDTTPGTIPQPVEYGYALAGGFALVYFGFAASTALYYTAVYRTGTQLRAALAQAIYRKTVRLSASSSQASHHPVNLMSSDVNRLTRHIDPLHQLWISCVMLAIGLIILHSQIGVSFVASIITIFTVIILLPWLSASIYARSAISSARADYRIRLISGIVNQIKGIKLTGYEPELLEKVADARKREAAAGRRTWMQFSKVVAVTSINSNLLSLVTLATYAIISVYGTGTDSLVTTRLFTVYTVMSVVAAPLMVAGQYWPGIVKSYQSIKRIETFLNYSEMEGVDYTSESDVIKEEPFGCEVRFDKATIGWEHKTVLDNMSFEIPLKKCTMITGHVASGKTTLISTLLQETEVISGRITYPWTRGSIAYCSQKPWIQSSRNLAENILFVSSMDSDWYNTVIKACALDVDFAGMPDGDQTGANKLSGGQQARVALARALYTRKEIFVLDDPLSALDSTTSAHVFEALLGLNGLLRGKTVIMSTNHASHIQAADLIVELNHEGVNVVRHNASFDAISSINIQMTNAGGNSLTSFPLDKSSANDGQKLTTKEDMPVKAHSHDVEIVNSGAIGLKTYVHYSRASGHHRTAIYTLLLVASVALQVVTPVYLQFWSTYNDSHQSDKDRGTQRVMLGKYLGGYAAFEASYGIAVIAVFFYALPFLSNIAGINLHGSAMSGVMASPLCFFTATTPGQILSRFSQDISLIDTDFPIAMYDLTYQGLSIIGSIVLLIVTVPYLAIVLVVVALLGYFVQKLYIATSRQIRRLELASNSPIYTLMSETLEVNGLFTIRAAGAEEALIIRNTRLLSPSQRTYHYDNVTKSWLNTMTAYLAAIINTFVMLIAVIGRHSTKVGLLGVAMSQIVSLQEAITLLLVSLAAAEVSIVAVERNLEYSQLIPEEPNDTKDSVQDWSVVAGMITFDSVTPYYNGCDEPVLKGISFQIPAGSHTALCGRTGSGKSTTFLALLRAIPFEGNIRIDGLTTTNLSIKTLRRNIAIVTQDPFVLEGTLRENLDMTGLLNDEEIWSALEAVQLKDMAMGLPNKLDQQLKSSGSDFSQGQIQLLALGRTLLRKNKIVILDEATANLDMETDRKIQQIIRSALKNVTVITIAHRIHTITDYDQIIVLNQGKIVEAGKPEDLLQNDDGSLAQLLKHDSSKPKTQKLT
ncbi:P-loop containing nucleoside triphosphate hydrolase protein [Gymnopus androsaceus JB14]|uniref:P-loop containing nucleoside triphosphate hydrolase protein n=1 Tax=Gymnopus androsaceus JB14 TaxID=1447944 RepID=A0A6A4GMU5_9AGAR|nr:P-loop containing nucleoside triphosphate hydrolase protein [Gymnopus androsaceus JB14]